MSILKIKKSLILFDRDGVINYKPTNGDRYILDRNKLKLDREIIALIATLQSSGHIVAVATNQQCVGKGLINLDQLNEIHDKINEAIVASGGHSLNFYVCPHLISNNCQCRKPKPGLLLRAMEDYKSMFFQAIFIGDSDSDKDAADSLSITFVKHVNNASETKSLLRKILDV